MNLVTPPNVFVDAEDLADVQPAVWRLVIDDEPRSGAANMAIDQALAEACAADLGPPVLRFYRWLPPAVSLGRHQAFTDIDTETVRKRGYEIVRRPTGGRAILHTDEFTYSVAAKADEPRLAGGVMDAYLSISNALVAGLQNLGVAAEKAPGTVRVGSDISAACFEAPSAYEITAGGRKLMGSAQSRRAGYVLQHGSLPLMGDITRLIDVLALDAARAAALRTELAVRACTLAEALGAAEDSLDVSYAAVCKAMQRGFETQMALSFKVTSLTPAEVRRAAALIREQYGNREWTIQR
ncbi:MAG: lipoate--protein ligase family protein [Anaerolineales bacterium]|nr:lipoate--protein ligase family protein [Anaerolineales bacterium]